MAAQDAPPKKDSPDQKVPGQEPEAAQTFASVGEESPFSSAPLPEQTSPHSPDKPPPLSGQPGDEGPPSPPTAPEPEPEPVPQPEYKPEETPSPPPPPPPPEPFVVKKEPEVKPAAEPSTRVVSVPGGLGAGIKRLVKPLLLLLGLLAVAAVVFALIRFLPQIRGRLPAELPAGVGEVRLTYWGLWEEGPIVETLITEYQRDHPNITISYQMQSPREYRERLQSALARGEGPDIFRFHNTWLPMLSRELASVPPSVMDAATFQETFYPVATQDLRRGGQIFGLPLQIDGLALYYNEEIFRTAGKTPPTSWDGLRKLASELTVRDDEGLIKVAGVALGEPANVDHWPDILGVMLLQNGADPADPTDELSQDSLTFFTLATRVDKVWDKSLPNSTAAFATGKLAMYLGPSWEAFEIKKLNPALSFKTAPIPQLPGETVTWASYWVEGVAAKSKNQAQAWGFLKFLSSKETLPKFYQAASQTRLFGEPYSRQDLAGLLLDDPYVGAYIAQAPSAQSWHMASRTFDNGINDRIIKYFEDAVNSVNTGDSAADALEVAAKGVKQVLSQYGVE